MKQLALLLLALPLLTFGQDQKAKSILDKLSDKTRSYSSIEAHFTNVFFSEIADVNESQKGVIYVKETLSNSKPMTSLLFQMVRLPGFI